MRDDCKMGIPVQLRLPAWCDRFETHGEIKGLIQNSWHCLNLNDNNASKSNPYVHSRSMGPSWGPWVHLEIGTSSTAWKGFQIGISRKSTWPIESFITTSSHYTLKSDQRDWTVCLLVQMNSKSTYKQVARDNSEGFVLNHTWFFIDFDVAPCDRMPVSVCIGLSPTFQLTWWQIFIPS